MKNAGWENLNFLRETAHFSNFYTGCAPTAESLEHGLAQVHTRISGRLVCLIGAKSGEDASDRRLLGEAAGRYAALTVLTGDPGCGDGIDLAAREITEGIEAAGGRYQVIPNREEAIRFLVDASGQGDTALLLRRQPDGEENGFLSDAQIVQCYLETR